MTQVIWKFTLRLDREQEIEMPRGSRILSVGCQFDQIQLWAMVDNETRDREARKFAVIGTGHHVPPRVAGRKFLGTVITEGGQFVWHVFDLT